AVTIVIEERAACAEARFGIQKSGRLGHVGKSSVSVVSVKNILTPAGDEQIFKAVVVVIANRNAVKVAGSKKAGLAGNIRECSIAVIFVETIGSRGWRIAVARAGEKKHVEPAVVIKIEERC